MKRLFLSCMVLFSTQLYGHCCQGQEGYDPYMDPKILDGLLATGCINLDLYNKFQKERIEKEHKAAVARERAAKQTMLGNIAFGVLVDVIQSAISGNNSHATWHNTRTLRFTDEEQLNEEQQPDKRPSPAPKSVTFPSAKQWPNNTSRIMTFPSKSQRPGSDIEEAKKEIVYHRAYQGRKH